MYGKRNIKPQNLSPLCQIAENLLCVSVPFLYDTAQLLVICISQRKDFFSFSLINLQIGVDSSTNWGKYIYM